MASGTTTEAAAEHGAEASVGMPQLDFSTFPNQIFWLVLSLIVVYFIVSKVILPRIGGVLEERHSVISDYISQAADFKKQAEQAEADYEAAKLMSTRQSPRQTLKSVLKRLNLKKRLRLSARALSKMCARLPPLRLVKSWRR